MEERRRDCDGAAGSDQGTDGSLAWDPCPALAAPTGATVRVTPAQVADFDSIVANASSGTTILLQKGTYALGGDWLLDYIRLTAGAYAPAPVDDRILRTWTTEDSCGNVASCTQIITFEDTTPPIVTCPPDVASNHCAQSRRSMTAVTRRCSCRPS